MKIALEKAVGRSSKDSEGSIGGSLTCGEENASEEGTSQGCKMCKKVTGNWRERDAVRQCQKVS